MKKYDFIKCKQCGEPLNRIIYGHLANGNLPKHTVSGGCEKTDYMFECSNYDCKKRYTKKEVFKFSFLPFCKPKLNEGFDFGNEKEWEIIVRQRQKKLQENFQLLLRELTYLPTNTKFTFSYYFDKLNIPPKERFRLYHDLMELLDGGVEVAKEHQGTISGLIFNIPHFRNEKRIKFLDPRKKWGVKEILEIVGNDMLYELVPPKTENGVTTFHYYKYHNSLMKFFKQLALYEYETLDNINEVAAKEISTLTEKETRLYLISIYRQEKYSTGIICNYIKDGRLFKLIEHYLEVCE